MIPHLGQITINAIVYKQTPSGQFDPKAVWHDSFSINLLEESPEKCIEELKRLITEFKDANASRPKPTT